MADTWEQQHQPCDVCAKMFCRADMTLRVNYAPGSPARLLCPTCHLETEYLPTEGMAGFTAQAARDEVGESPLEVAGLLPEMGWTATPSSEWRGMKSRTLKEGTKADDKLRRQRDGDRSRGRNRHGDRPLTDREAADLQRFYCRRNRWRALYKSASIEAVRKRPDVAAEELRKLGWTVTPPGE